jgi:Rrf2 family protein
MRANTRFTEAIQILCLIALKKDNMSTSDHIAESVNTNPVVIRRIFKNLKDAGFIAVKRGIGGTYLLQQPNQITLFDIYCAVENEDKRAIFKFHEGLNSKCIVGSHIEEVLKDSFTRAQDAMENELRQVTLEDIIDQIKINKN